MLYRDDKHIISSFQPTGCVVFRCRVEITHHLPILLRNRSEKEVQHVPGHSVIILGSVNPVTSFLLYHCVTP